jgi:hypothetical protein
VTDGSEVFAAGSAGLILPAKNLTGTARTDWATYERDLAVV